VMQRLLQMVLQGPREHREHRDHLGQMVPTTHLPRMEQQLTMDLTPDEKVLLVRQDPRDRTVIDRPLKAQGPLERGPHQRLALPRIHGRRDPPRLLELLRATEVPILPGRPVSRPPRSLSRLRAIPDLPSPLPQSRGR
jgi:hypothetical protein